MTTKDVSSCPCAARTIGRHSILLVDFIEHQREQNVPVGEAVIRPGAMRTRPILLVAVAEMVGAFVIILDPIFQGPAVSLQFGVSRSTLRTLLVNRVLDAALVHERGRMPQPLCRWRSRQT